MLGINWDLVIIDEAHKLRNLYTESNKIDQSIASIFKDTFKLLLTATPLQNSLLDLYSTNTKGSVSGCFLYDIFTFQNQIDLIDNQ